MVINRVRGVDCRWGELIEMDASFCRVAEEEIGLI